MTTLALFLALQVQAGDRPKYKPRPKPKVAAAAPVTHAEARAVLARVQLVADRTLRVPAAPFAGGLPSDNKPVSGEDLVAELRRLTLRYEPYFRLTAPVPKGATAEQRFAIYRMFSPTGPLALGAKTLAPAVFGDAAGYFLIRIADMTHTPRKEYSPAIMGGG